MAAHNIVLAARTVYDTTELLENILIYLPLSDLIHRLSLVSQRCNAVIKDSKALRETLWLEPDLPNFRWRYFESMENCYLQKVARDRPLGREPDEGDELATDRKTNFHVLEDLRLNPIVFFKQEPWRYYCDWDPAERERVYFSFPSGGAWYYHSCSAIFATQPPTKQLVISANGVNGQECVETAENENGVTVADVLCALGKLPTVELVARFHLEDYLVLTKSLADEVKMDEIVVVGATLDRRTRDYLERYPL